MATKGAQQPLGATVSGQRPGDYALGSVESRAAARAVVEQRRDSQKRRELVIMSSIPRPNYENDPEFTRSVQLFTTGTWPKTVSLSAPA